MTEQPNPQKQTGPNIPETVLKMNSWEIIQHTGYIKTLLWALTIGGATALISYLTLPHYYLIPTALLGFILGVIAAVDQKTYLIKNVYTLTALTVTLATLVILPLLNHTTFWNALWGIIGALIMLGIFIFLVLALGFSSGGDIKLAPVIALYLTSINPLLPFIWLMLSLILSLLHLTVTKSKHIAFGVGMALAFPLSILATGLILTEAGYGY